MNKYLGFHELKFLDIPTVPWMEFNVESVLDDVHLWTVRVAVEEGNDLNLPRVVGVKAEEAYKRGLEFLKTYEGREIVIYYPNFIC